MSELTYVVRQVISDPRGYRPVIAVINSPSPGKSYIMSDITPGVDFPTESEALLAGARAIEAVTTTGAWPNMCAPF